MKIWNLETTENMDFGGHIEKLEFGDPIKKNALASQVMIGVIIRTFTTRDREMRMKISVNTRTKMEYCCFVQPPTQQTR